MANRRILARIGAFVLAASLVFVDAAPVLAAEKANVSAGQDEKGSVSGVSKVIGLEGRGTSWSSMTINGEQKKYVRLNQDYYEEVVVLGQAEKLKDAATGLYKYDGKYYAHAYDRGSTMVALQSEVLNPVFVSNTLTWEEREKLLPQEDPATGMYVVNGKYYPYRSSRSVYNANDEYIGSTYYIYKSNEVAVYEMVAADADVRALYGVKANPENSYPSYYTIKGRNFDSIDWNYVYDANGNEKKCVVAYVADEISFDKRYHQINWQSVSNMTELDYKGKLVKIGYQVKVDGEMVDLDYYAMNGKKLQSFNMSTSYTNRTAFASGKKAKYEVRAVYYTTTKTKVKDPETNSERIETSYNIVKTGAWSEPYSYAWKKATKTVPQVTGLKATQKTKSTVELTWKEVDIASYYRVEYIKSVTPITDWSKVSDDDWNWTTTSNTKYTVNNSNLGTVYVYDEATDTGSYVEANYAYYRVSAGINYDEDLYVNTVGKSSSIITVTKAVQKANTPKITGLTVEKAVDGSFKLTWDDVDDARVYVYYSTDKNMFKTKEYTYGLVNARADVNNTPDYTWDDEYLTNAEGLQDKLSIVNKKVDRYDYLPYGATSVSSNSLDLVPGKTYYFVVATYDDLNGNTDRTSKPFITYDNVAYGYYNDLVTSKTVSAKATITVEEPTIKSEKTSITMSFDKNNSLITGYEILRKSGSKYKKVATITSAQFVDEDLKANTTYNYKVRAYHYNPDTKASAYSEYVYFAAETSSDNYITLNAVQASKTSAKLTWTKVAGATKYEIYRTNTHSVDDQYTKKNGTGNGAYALGNDKWELVKTITNPKTVKYTDKKLTSGDNYTYRVVATYKSGSKTKQLYAADSVSFALATPTNVKTTLSKTTVKVTWEKNYYASKYEVSYMIYDAQGNAKSEKEVVKTTTKPSYSIKKVPAGGYVEVAVRAYGNKKWSGYATVGEEGKGLAAVKGVTAKQITEKTAAGKEYASVKISWKKVDGAAYYRVYRSTSPVSGYNKDDKVYYRPNDTFALIAKEANTDETNSTVLYDQYKGYSGTITKTSAVDRTKLKSGVTYYYYVIAYSKNGEQMSDGYTAAASVCYDATPEITKITAKKGKTIVKIAKVDGAKKYVVYRSTKKTSGYKEIGTTTKTTYTDKTTKKNTTYYYKVVAIGKNALKADFESPKSAAVKVKAK